MDLRHTALGAVLARLSPNGSVISYSFDDPIIRMTGSTTHIDTLRVQAPEGMAQRVQLRLSTQLVGADLRPSGLAPAEVLLVKTLPDPEPRRVSVDGPVPVLDRTWERAVRHALDDRLRRAVRPTEGQVPPGAASVLFRDSAEAWACWTRERVRPDPLAGTAWWVRSLEQSADLPSSPRDALSVPAVWRARPRLVPPMVGALAAWDAVESVVQQLSKADAEAILEATCAAYNVPWPPIPPDRGDDAVEATASIRDAPSEETARGISKRTGTGRDAGWPPWTEVVERAGGSTLCTTLERQSRAHRALFGVALALRDDPETVRARSFRAAWQAWWSAADERRSEGRGERAPSSDSQSGGGDDGIRKPSSREDEATHSEARPPSPSLEENEGGRPASGEDEGDPIKAFSWEEGRDTPALDRKADSRGDGAGKDGYAATDLGGVLYLVNVLDALDLPAAATTPPVDGHVGAWAALEALARALLGTDPDVLRPDDPLWRVLAVLDGRDPGTPAGRALEAAVDSPPDYRMPSAWLDAPHVDAPIEGRWAVQEGRLRVWADVGPVAELEADDDPAAQAEAVWDPCPNTGPLRRANSFDQMPLAPVPESCAPALAHWAARTAAFVRHRLAAALTSGDVGRSGLDDLFALPGRLYTTDMHVDLVLPLDAARLDVRAAGLDRSPGWWPAGGRVVRFHFRDLES